MLLKVNVFVAIATNTKNFEDGKRQLGENVMKMKHKLEK